jgi:hypothetical protein
MEETQRLVTEEIEMLKVVLYVMHTRKQGRTHAHIGYRADHNIAGNIFIE